MIYDASYFEHLSINPLGKRAYQKPIDANWLLVENGLELRDGIQI